MLLGSHHRRVGDNRFLSGGYQTERYSFFGDPCANKPADQSASKKQRPDARTLQRDSTPAPVTDCPTLVERPR